ncbi:Monooxygenase, FAD-binding [Penicillium occitanis (nom. inval.)]|nr:Monooxygenase, FAD-binding [Penicillium occitanis (nom. inval.)]
MASESLSSPLKVVIVGAGIAGLSAAIALGKQGHDVVILEKSRFAKETGAAIHLPPNCTVLLKWMDINPADFGGTLLREIHRYRGEGDLKFIKDFADARKTWQSEWYLVHRVDLHNYLKEVALKTAVLHTGCNVVDVNIEEPRVVLDDGREFRADLLLGADGVHSMLRDHIAPDSAPPYPTGKACFRWLVPVQSLMQSGNTKELVQKPGVFMEWAADDRRLVAYPCSNNTVYNLCGFGPTAEAGVQDGVEGKGWQITGNKDSLAQIFIKFSTGVRELIDLADANLKVWQLYDMESLPTWVKDQAALIGDAAHPFQPYMGQGGAMAIEDAVSIATLIPRGTTVEDIPGRLRLYEMARKSRVEKVLEYTRMNGRDENDVTGPRVSPAGVIEFMLGQLPV